MAGNPSDGYGGVVLAVPVPALVAQVALTRVDATTGRDEPAAALLGAATQVLAEHLGCAIDGVVLGSRTSIPRSCGLAGSSALVIAALRALTRHLEVTVPPLVLAALALRAERDVLGIEAGWQDRVVQALEAPVLVDTSRLVAVDGLASPVATVLARPRRIGLLVAWDEQLAAPSGELHGSLRQRYDGGEPVVVEAMPSLAAAARRAATAVAHDDGRALQAAVRETAALRRAIGALAPATDALVEVAEAAGAAATSAGSGGAVTVVVEPARRAAVAGALAAAGAATTTVW